MILLLRLVYVSCTINAFFLFCCRKTTVYRAGKCNYLLPLLRSSVLALALVLFLT